MSPLQAKLFPIVIGVVAVVAIGLQVPAIIEQRNIAEDQQKSTDISSLSNEVQTYSSKESKVPSSLDQLTIDDKALALRRGQYEYKTTGTKGSYEICATFKTEAKGSNYSSSPKPLAEDTSSSSVRYDKTDPSVHGIGHECFTFQSYYYDYTDPYIYGGGGVIDDTPSPATPTKKL
jgi:hypothetical protein